ncbi:hypothetical protein LTR37_019638 [Vermiconidia calcicola]|uniref:Uncharacterized protein n=1 Tax=Vermiconidia calcicola TaxID=1690605 RepID=A0ACC3MEQ2_9PEZI|nr:hypothetical protein LTR37_019638 [Vermiconidia calcicola]
MEILDILFTIFVILLALMLTMSRYNTKNALTVISKIALVSLFVVMVMENYELCDPTDNTPSVMHRAIHMMILLWFAWKIGGHIEAAQDTYRIPVTSRDSIYKDPVSTADAVTTDASTATTNAATNGGATRPTRRPTRKQWNRTHDEGCISSTGSRSSVKFEPLLSAKAREELLRRMHDASDVDDFQETMATLKGYSRMGHFRKVLKEEEKEEGEAKEEERLEGLAMVPWVGPTTQINGTPELPIDGGERAISTRPYWSPQDAAKIQPSALVYDNGKNEHDLVHRGFHTPKSRLSCYGDDLLPFKYGKNDSEDEPLAGLTTEDAYTKRYRGPTGLIKVRRSLRLLSLSDATPCPAPGSKSKALVLRRPNVDEGSEPTSESSSPPTTDIGDGTSSTGIADSATTPTDLGSELEQSVPEEEVEEEGRTEGEDNTTPPPQPSGEQAQPTTEPAASCEMGGSEPSLMGGNPHFSSEGAAAICSDIPWPLPQPSGDGSDAMGTICDVLHASNNSDGGPMQFHPIGGTVTQQENYQWAAPSDMHTPEQSSGSVGGGGGDGGDSCACPEVEMGDGRPTFNFDDLAGFSYRRVPKRALNDAEGSSPHSKRRCQGAAQMSQKPSLLMRRAGVQIRPTIPVLSHKRKHDEYIDSDFAVDIDGDASMDGDASKAVKIVPVDAGIDPDDAAKVKRVPSRGGDSHYSPGSDWAMPEKDRNRLKWVKPDEAPKFMMSWLRLSVKAADGEKHKPKPEDSTLEVIKLRLQQTVEFGLNNEGRWNEAKVSKDLIRSVGYAAEDLNAALMVAWKGSGAPRTRNLVQVVAIKSALAGKCVEVLRQLVRACELYKGDRGGRL